MKHIYEGKTKTVYELENGNYLLKFKDDATGTDGVFDPGSNTVALSIEGLGKGGLKLTAHFFAMLASNGVRTHFVRADFDAAEMEVLPATSFGDGVEVICRFKAAGSFVRRYGGYAETGMELDALVEVTLKDDAREDPPITKDTLAMLGILSNGEYESLKAQTQKISRLLKAELERFGCDLYDLKLEFGRNGGEVILIDEISAGNMRVFKDGRSLEPLELASIVTGG
ncbi:MAG: phosphoribosylaminoimidazolesuccinocarboxamide synthase [Defluviitaleaceae bacterium]|nr:phosphoribosylaminoimidazolesuccinocarboxamide synthase [Defluviitaleaceae bacterium]